MFDINLEEVLKVAKEMGIEYEMNSKTPGFFIEENGEERRVSFDGIFEEESYIQEFDIDLNISLALNSGLSQRETVEIRSKHVYFISNLDEVA